MMQTQEGERLEMWTFPGGSEECVASTFFFFNFY